MPSSDRDVLAERNGRSVARHTPCLRRQECWSPMCSGVDEIAVSSTGVHRPIRESWNPFPRGAHWESGPELLENYIDTLACRHEDLIRTHLRLHKDTR